MAQTTTPDSAPAPADASMPALGNLGPSLRHDRTLCTFGGTGEPVRPSFTAIEFAYYRAWPARALRLTVPLVCFDGVSQAMMQLVDLSGDRPLATWTLSGVGRPTGI